ncbi:MAG TPA: hypothetical protein VGM88_06955 [Kofleriaceae bacterium]|jgi:poly(3-hydroxybutyrate) depolymerase
MRVIAVVTLLAACAGDSPANPPDPDGAPGSDSGGSDATHPGSDAGPIQLTPGQSTITLTAAGQSRTAILYVPASASAGSQLAIALHGNGDTDGNFLATSGLKALADGDGTVLVVPQGITRDVTVPSVGQTIPGIDWDAYNSVADGNIDLPLLEALRMRIAPDLDANHVFVFGYSQGGYLAFEYGMYDGNSLSCSAVLAASSPYGGSSGDPEIGGAQRHLPVVLQIGTADSAYSAAQATVSTLMTDGFPAQLNAIDGAGHVPIPGDVADPWNFCRAKSL